MSEEEVQDFAHGHGTLFVEVMNPIVLMIIRM